MKNIGKLYNKNKSKYVTIFVLLIIYSYVFMNKQLEPKTKTPLDMWSLTHIEHGIILYYVADLLKINKLFFVLLFEICFEIFENSSFGINIFDKIDNVGYTGDNFYNSLCDIISCIFGYVLATQFNHTTLIIIIIILEIIVYVTIKESLFTVIVNLLYFAIYYIIYFRFPKKQIKF